MGFCYLNWAVFINEVLFSSFREDFFFNLLFAKVRIEKEIALAVASSGIAGTLL